MKITVFGAGKSGIAVAKALHARHDIFLSEEKERMDAATLKKLKNLNVSIETGGHTKKAIQDADLIVLSPGVPLDIPLIKLAKRQHIPVIGEVELAFRFLKKPIIAVTGTNGKTTTTALIGQMLRDNGYSVAVAGNIGYPLILVDDRKLDYIVAEISSYQLETIDKFRPWISILLNITEDHLIRHGSMKEYMRQKAAIFRNQGRGDHLIYNYDDKRVKDISTKSRCAKLAFSQKRHLSSGAYLKDDLLFFNGTKICNINDIRIKGAHNIENCLAAVSAAALCGVPARSIAGTLKKFKGVEHRVEFVKKIKGVSFYNDSKGTNPDSTIVAIKALASRHGLVLILGGRDKMTDLRGLCRAVKNSVKDVVLIGEAKTRFRTNLRKWGFKRLHDSPNFRDAVRRSYSLAAPGDAVLLSPACASFDMFSNFEERGKVFKKIVANL